MAELLCDICPVGMESIKDVECESCVVRDTLDSFDIGV